MNNDNFEEIVFNVKSKEPTSTPTEHRKNMFSSVDNSFSLEMKERTLSQKQYDEIVNQCSVVVHDYCDEYHMSEEERKKRFKNYEAFSKIIRCKRKFRKLDEFVKVFRLCLDCLMVVSDNGVYEPEKFIKLVLKKKIKVNGLNFPKYIGKDKKQINWEYIAEFILDYSRDPKELSKDIESELSDLDDEELEERLFNEDELNKYLDIINNPEEDNIIVPIYGDGDDKREDIISLAEKSDMKELVKYAPEVVRGVRELTKEQRKRRASNGRLNSFVYEMTEDDFEYIERLDNKRGFYSDSDIPRFEGDIMKRKDRKKYLAALKDYENEQIKVNYQGKMRSQSEINEIELKNALEQAGWNVRNLYRYKEQEKKLKEAIKKDKKREEELRKRLMRIQDRQKKRSGSDVEFNSKKKKKKDKDKKKKKKESD